MPQIPEEGEMVFEGLFHPQIREILEQEGRAFQAVDLKLEKGTTVITGSQYGRKDSVVEKCAIGAIPDAVRFLCTCPAGGYARSWNKS